MPRRRDRGLRQPGGAAAPGQVRPLVDFDVLSRGIEAKLQDAQKFMGKFPQIPEVKRTPKVLPLITQPRKSGMVGGGYEGWLILHPLRLLRRIFRKQNGKIVVEGDRTVLKQPGFFAARTQNRRMAAAAAWRNESGVERRMHEARQRLENSMLAAAGELRAKVENGTVRQENVGDQVGIYNKAAGNAWLHFQAEITGILKEYRQGAVERGVIEKSKLA